MRTSLFGAFLVALTVSVIIHAQPAQKSAAASAPAATADLSGVWMPNVNYTSYWEPPPETEPWTKEKIGQYRENVPRPRAARQATGGGPRPAVVPMTAWAEAIFKYNGTPDGADEGRRNEVDSYSHCSPPGVPRNWAIRRPYEIIQEPHRVLILFEGDHWVRQIWTDGRGHPPNVGRTWGGHSIGKWDGDTLVVDTVGFNDKSWIDIAGHPHSEALHLTERLRRVDPDHLLITITFEDPKAFTKPWTGSLLAALHPDWVIGEVIPCEDAILGHPIPKISGMPIILRPKR
ncbi:MAG: hypothetical protein A3J28_07705 [Acidobacteria bacterium RIFCSPLOWO2_12_FULL_60_22]|nr:MAG: hypothetical protein A3J28_07705 [Acidobacteria bacterium RIFCSPLOWO2_12_FULL_60_22]